MSEKAEVHFAGKVAQKALIVRSDGKVLVTRDVRDPDTWELPGGRLNLGERPAEGLERELKEELGVECVAEEVVLVEQSHHVQDDQTALFLVYKVTLKDENASFSVDPTEVTELDWVDQDSWQQHQYFPEYELALQNYFENL